MARNLTPLGHARVYRHPATGELVVDTDSLRRSGFAGQFGYDDEDDFGEDDYEDFGEEDDFDDEEDFGASGRRRARRQARKQGRGQRRSARRQPAATQLPVVQQPAQGPWGMTAVGGTDTLSSAGPASVKIRLQHDFRAQDITFTGSAGGAKVTSIFFGDRVVWSTSDGIDVSVFASNSFLRGLLKGQSLRAGLDITVNGSLGGAGDFAATLVGEKPVDSHC